MTRVTRVVTVVEHGVERDEMTAGLVGRKMTGGIIREVCMCVFIACVWWGVWHIGQLVDAVLCLCR